MFRWSNKRINWYDRACKVSKYHENIYNNIEEYLTKDDRVFDIACGLGYISTFISKNVENITAIDIDKNAIQSLNQRCKGNNINNIMCVNQDWKQYAKKYKSDISIISYCNGMIEDLEILKSITSKYIIGIYLWKNKVSNFSVHDIVDIEKTFDRRETTDKICKYLDENNIKYNIKKILCEFGQPFTCKEEVVDFVKEYFKIYDEDKIKQFIDDKLEKTQTGYYLPNLKKSGIIIIDMKQFKK